MCAAEPEQVRVPLPRLAVQRTGQGRARARPAGGNLVKVSADSHVSCGARLLIARHAARVSRVD